MRTIRYTFNFQQPDSEKHSIELSTEIILDNDDDAYEEGAKVSVLFDKFLDGLTDGEEE